MHVEIMDTCVACGLCESINSDVFKVNGMARAFSGRVRGNEEDCQKAAALCPVGAIIIS